MISAILSRLVILLFGTLYPAYASYKAVKTKHFKEYVKWMMYWIVFALFTCIETFTDVFLSWFPFYYEIKIILVIWLLSPATNGSSFLYRKFVHPMLSSREQEIDEYISKAKEQSYKQVLDLGQKGVSALMQTAIKGGGGLVNQLKKSYSLSDLTDPNDEIDQTEHDSRIVRSRRRPNNPLDGSVTSASTTSVYFGEVDIRSDRIGHVQSVEDISSGYSSGEGLYKTRETAVGLARAGSLTRTRTGRVTRSSTVNRRSTGSDDSPDTIYLNDQVMKITELTDEQCEQDIFYDTIAENNGGNMNNSKIECRPQIITACDSNNVTRRGGKYNKCIAPSPPIKATLVLQAGLVKSVPTINNDDNSTKCKKEVFVAIKRKSKNFLNLPNILNIGHKNKIVKRSSWHGCGDLLTTNSKLQSKSVNQLCD